MFSGFVLDLIELHEDPEELTLRQCSISSYIR
jgi:hypothetical protein